MVCIFVFVEGATCDSSQQEYSYVAYFEAHIIIQIFFTLEDFLHRSTQN